MAKSKLDFHVVAKNNSKQHCNGTDNIFKVAKKPHADDSKSFDYRVYASEHDRQWNSYYYKSPMLSVESDGNKLTVTKNMSMGKDIKTYVLEYDEAQELLLALWLRYEDRNSYKFKLYKKGKNGKRTSGSKSSKSRNSKRK